MKQIKAQIFKLFCLLLVVTFVFSGCATKINDAFENQNKDKNVVTHEYNAAAVIENEEEKETSSMISVGESFDAVIDIERKDGTKETIGQKGLRYTINSVEVFENIYESGVELNTSVLSWDSANNEYYISDDAHNAFINNMFILLDVTVTYNAPEDSKAEITISFPNDIRVHRDEEKLPEDWLDEFVALREQKIYVTDPSDILYFSCAPMPDEITFDMDKDDMLPQIKDGETINLQLGFYCWEKFVEYKCLYLQINSYNTNFINNYDGKYVVIFPEE